MVQRFATPWLWPRQPAKLATWTVRIGRVIHWLSVFAALVALVFGFIIAIEARSSHAASLREIDDWDTRSAAKPSKLKRERPHGFGYDPIIGELKPSRRARGITECQAYGNCDSNGFWIEKRPLERSAYPKGFMIVLLAVFTLPLGGRAVRYIIANE
jgi:hypothetical protein